jgi:hypothetical protein
MKTFKIAIAFVFALLTLPSVACGGHGMYRIQQMNVVDFLSFNRVATGIIVGVEKDSMNEGKSIYTMRITEQFKGPESSGTIEVGGAEAWRLTGTKVGSQALFFTEMKDGKEVMSSQDLTMPIATGFSLKENLANAPKDNMSRVVDAHERNQEEMDIAFKKFRSFAPVLTEGAHQYKEGDNLLFTFIVKNGKLNGEFESFTLEGDTYEKGQYVNGRRVGEWSMLVGDDEYRVVQLDNEITRSIWGH